MMHLHELVRLVQHSSSPLQMAHHVPFMQGMKRLLDCIEEGFGMKIALSL